MAETIRAAVIGLGSMGWGAAVSLLRAGIPTVGCDVREEVLERFRAAGGETAQSPAGAAAEADVVFSFVVNAEQTEAVLFGPEGALPRTRPGTVVVSSATVPPSYADDLGRRLSEAGMLPIDGPVSGGAAKAESGEMAVMASGPDEAFEKAGPALDAIAAKVYRLGTDPGAGSRVKMINQLLAGVHIAATAEALTFGIRSGIDPATLLEVISASAGSSWMFQNRGPHIVEGDYTPRSAVDIFVKDLGIVAAEAEAAGFPVPLTATALEQFRTAADAGLGREDDAAVAKVYARRGGVTLPGTGQ